jgi:hypothetical protein
MLTSLVTPLCGYGHAEGGVLFVTGVIGTVHDVCLHESVQVVLAKKIVASETLKHNNFPMLSHCLHLRISFTVSSKLAIAVDGYSFKLLETRFRREAGRIRRLLGVMTSCDWSLRSNRPTKSRKRWQWFGSIHCTLPRKGRKVGVVHFRPQCGFQTHDCAPYLFPFVVSLFR